jgi:hypothetical protein
MVQGWLAEFPEIRAGMHNLEGGMEAGIKQLQQLVGPWLWLRACLADSDLPEDTA